MNDIIFEKIKFEDLKLRSFFLRRISQELSNLTQPCYAPEHKKDHNTLFYLTGLNIKDVREFVKRFYEGTPAAIWELESNPISNLLIICMKLFLDNKDMIGYSSAMTFFTIMHYSNVFHRFFPKYCNDDTFKYALQNVNKIHLFYREGSIANALFYLGKEMQRKHETAIKNMDPMEMSKFLRELRTRIFRSLKSFAEAYHKYFAMGLGVKQPYEGKEDDENTELLQYQNLEQYTRLVDEISKKLIVYKYIDDDALNYAWKITKINSNLTHLITKSITRDENLELIQNCIRLFLKDLKDMKHICGKDFNSYIKKLMSTKKMDSGFKQQILKIQINILKDIKFEKEYEKLSSQTKYMILFFISLYVCNVIKNSIC